ncbi:MAG: hypothetical protein Ta2G_08540 [Termitinemataceae bacterium]|nr:MAG: hypothetical protein Ta2G_08540 [Termitinemataceae bacterium]
MANYDLWTVLLKYTLNNNQSMIDLNIFLKFLRFNGEKNPEMSQWHDFSMDQLKTDLMPLLREGKCKYQNVGLVKKLFVPYFFVEKLKGIYSSTESDKAFPSEKSTHMEIPAECIRQIPLDTGLVDYLKDPQKEPLPILKITFPQGFGDAIVLPEILPLRFLELSVLKVKESFRKKVLFESCKQKCMIHFANQQSLIKEFFDTLLTRPANVVDALVNASEFSFSFWFFICPILKAEVIEDIERSRETSQDNLALFQAVSYIFIINNYFKITTVAIRDRELFLAEMESKFAEPPYIFTLSEIMGFKNKNGTSILEKIPEADFSAFLQRRMTSNNPDVLPEFLQYVSLNDEKYIVRKDKVWPVLELMVKESGATIKGEISARWTKLLKDYHREKAMDTDSEFEALINRNARLFCPLLITILHEIKTALVQIELENEKSRDGRLVRYFDVDKLMTLQKIFNMNRGDILNKCKFSLPFWYSIPIVVSFLCFLKNGFGSQYVNNFKKGSGKDEDGVNQDALKMAATKVARNLVPEGTDITSYIYTIQDRWLQILNKQERERLANDVDANIRDYVRQVLKIGQRSSISDDLLNDTAYNILNMHAALKNIKNRASLILYIKLYIVKCITESKI